MLLLPPSAFFHFFHFVGPGLGSKRRPLIWGQTVCKDYQQMTKVFASKERVNYMRLITAHFNSYTAHVSHLTIH